jgi:hypothetical protein
VAGVFVASAASAAAEVSGEVSEAFASAASVLK